MNNDSIKIITDVMDSLLMFTVQDPRPYHDYNKFLETLDH